MSVGKQGSAQVTVNLDDSGGTPRAISNFVMELGGAKITVNQQSSHAFADAWFESTPTGTLKGEPIKIGGLFDTTPTVGPHVVMNPVVAVDADPNGITRTLAIVFGDGKTFTVECRLGDYEVTAQIDNLTKFAATLIPTGAVVWS